MTVPNPHIKFTYDDYRNAPEDKRYELLDGDLVMTPAPAEIHQRTVTLLGWKLAQFVAEHGAGRVYVAPFDVVLSNTDVVQPDLLFVSNARAHVVTAANVQGAPDLVVEILSPSTADRDLTFKRRLYARHGVSEYWIVDTDAGAVTVLLLREGEFEVAAEYKEGETLTSPALHGFALRIDDLFGE
jgi:Uma2 family endonuclease